MPAPGAARVGRLAVDMKFIARDAHRGPARRGWILPEGCSRRRAIGPNAKRREQQRPEAETGEGQRRFHGWQAERIVSTGTLAKPNFHLDRRSSAIRLVQFHRERL